jgi:hypothetical protein
MVKDFAARGLKSPSSFVRTTTWVDEQPLIQKRGKKANLHQPELGSNQDSPCMETIAVLGYLNRMSNRGEYEAGDV